MLRFETGKYVPPTQIARRLCLWAALAGALYVGAGCKNREASSDPWNDPHYWPGSSILDPLIGLDQAPKHPRVEVWMCLSKIDYGEAMTCKAIGHTMSTLDLTIRRGVLILMGGINTTVLGYPEFQGKHLYAITTTDLKNFGTRMWRVEKTERGLLTDASLEHLPDGTMRAVYYSGPADAPGPHAIKAAYRHGDVFIEHPEPIYVAPGLLDPVTCRINNTYHLFGTVFGTSLDHATGSQEMSYTHTPDLDHVRDQVPFCFERQGKLWLVAQTDGGWQPPTVRVLSDDGTFSPPRSLWKDGEYTEITPCTSPVVGEFMDEFVLFCAVAKD